VTFSSLAALAKQPQNAAAGNIEQPDQRRADLRQDGHGRRHPDGDAFRIAQRDLLGHEFADDQRTIGDEGDDHADAERVGDIGGNAGRNQRAGQAKAERGARKGAGKHADQRDADLDCGQELSRIGAERQSAAGALDVAVDHGFEPGGPRRHDGKLGHRQEAVDADEDDHDADFKVQHGLPIAPRQRLREGAGGQVERCGG
jgi:hypothetical protein